MTRGIGFQVIGLPDDAIKESLSRIFIAIDKIDFYMPRTKLVINLAPASLRKRGTGFDLAALIGILIASGQLDDFVHLQDYCIVGEVGLDGSVYPVRGVLCMVCQAKRDGFKGIVVPTANAADATHVHMVVGS